MDLFLPSRLKLLRARQHVAELDALLATALEENPMRARLTNTTKTDQGLPEAHYEGVVPAPPEMAAPIIGDVVHNVRSSLDLMASELARLNQKNDNNVYFPFAESSAGLDEMITRKNFSRCGSAAVALLRSFKPYKNGNQELRVIHDLDVIDKHRSLIPGAQINPGNVSLFDLVGPAINGKQTIRFKDPVFKNTRYVFPAGTILEGREIISALKQMVDLCEGILEAFAALKGSDQSGVNAERGPGS